MKPDSIVLELLLCSLYSKFSFHTQSQTHSLHTTSGKSSAYIFQGSSFQCHSMSLSQLPKIVLLFPFLGVLGPLGISASSKKVQEIAICGVTGHVKAWHHHLKVHGESKLNLITAHWQQWLVLSCGFRLISTSHLQFLLLIKLYMGYHRVTFTGSSYPLFRKKHWRRKWQPTPVFLPGESHGQRSLAGYSPGGQTESDTHEAT